MGEGREHMCGGAGALVPEAVQCSCQFFFSRGGSLPREKPPVGSVTLWCRIPPLMQLVSINLDINKLLTCVLLLRGYAFFLSLKRKCSAGVGGVGGGEGNTTLMILPEGELCAEQLHLCVGACVRLW